MVAGVSTKIVGIVERADARCSAVTRLRAIPRSAAPRGHGAAPAALERRGPRRPGPSAAGPGAAAAAPGVRATPPAARLLHGAHAHARRARGVVGQQEVLAQREALVVGRHVDAAQVAVALEDDAEHVVGLALGPLGAVPEEGDRRHARVVARQAVGDDAQPVRARAATRGGRRPACVVPGVDAGEVGQQLEAQLRVVVQGAHARRSRDPAAMTRSRSCRRARRRRHERGARRGAPARRRSSAVSVTDLPRRWWC